MESMPPPPRHRSRSALILMLVVLVIVAAGLVLIRQTPEWIDRAAGRGPGCVAEAGSEKVELTADQAQRATDLAAEAWRSGDDALARLPTRLSADPALDLDATSSRTVAAVVSGREAAGLQCRAEPTRGEGRTGSNGTGALNREGLTPTAARVLDDMRGAFGPLPTGGYAPGGVDTGHMPGSAHYDGRAIDVFFRPITEANLRHGWAVSAYLVAHANRLNVRNVIFDDRIFSVGGRNAWRDYEVDTSGRSEATALILRHRDHVHVDVGR